MRIGFDAKRAFYNNTGLGNYSRDSIRILANHYSQNEYFLYTPEKKKNNRLDFLNDLDNTFVRTPFSFIGNLFKTYWRSKNIVKDLLQDKIDIYHGLSHELPLSIEQTDIKTVVTIHDLIFIRYPELFSKIDRKIYYYKFKSACERADRIIAVSKQTKKDIINFFNIPAEKIEVIYQGCNNIFQQKLNKNEKDAICSKYKIPKNFILYVGTIERRKNLLTLLKAILKLKNCHLVVIGKGKKYKEECLSFIKKNNLESRVYFLSNLSVSEMSGIYQSADLMVYPSIFEGFGIPILEALFSRTPVITTKGGCFIEAGGPESIYIDPLSTKQIQENIERVLDDSNLSEKMRIEGLKYAQKFTDEKIAKNLINIYKKIQENI